MRIKKKQPPSGVVQLCLFSTAEMKAMEERHVNFKPLKDIIWEMELLPGFKGQCHRDLRTFLTNKKLHDRLKVAPNLLSREGIRRGVRVIDS